MSAARWTGVVDPHPNGEFVAYGDYLTLNRELSTARAQLAERDALISKLTKPRYLQCCPNRDPLGTCVLSNPIDCLYPDCEHQEWQQDNILEDQQSAELARLRADAERWQWIRDHWNDLDQYHDIWDSDDTPEGFDAAIDAARREGKESTNNNNNNQQIQSKEQESSASNTKLGGESVGFDHRVTSPIQSERESKT